MVSCSRARSIKTGGIFGVDFQRLPELDIRFRPLDGGDIKLREISGECRLILGSPCRP
jgi:hypothetical protein